MVEKSTDEFDPLKHLSGLRNDWSDEIPPEVIHSDSGIKSKVRRNWFTGVTADVSLALDENEIGTPQGRKAADKLIKRFTSKKFQKQALTTERDIQEANHLIDTILGK